MKMPFSPLLKAQLDLAPDAVLGVSALKGTRLPSGAAGSALRASKIGFAFASAPAA